MIVSKSLDLEFNLKMTNTIQVKTKGVPKRIFLCLHGYLLDGAYMVKEFSDMLGDDCLIISPNGPYLVPVKKGEEYFPKYSWYFFDPIKKNYYINYDPAADFLGQVLRHFNTHDLPVSILGYSQGGYLAPRVANYDKNIDQVISLASVYRPDRFEIEPHVEYNQINSKSDLVVDYKDAQEESLEMLKKTKKYCLTLIEASGHRIDKSYKEKLALILKS